MADTRWVSKTIRTIAMNKLVQKPLINRVDKYLYKSVVDEGLDDIKAIGLHKYEWSSSLLHRAIENVNKGYLSRHVLDSMIDTLVDELFLKNSEEIQKKRKEYYDAYGMYPPFFLVISPTQRCNLNCIGCYAASDKTTSPTIPFDVLDRIVTEAETEWGCKFIVISGGEPLMYRDNGKTLLDLFELHPHIFFMFYTNGTLINAEMAQRLEKLANGIPAISVEGFEKETDARRGAGTYKKILSAMENLRNVGMPFAISVTSTSENVDVLLSDEFYQKHFDEYGAIFMWQFQLMPIGRGKEAFQLMPTPEQRVALYRRWESLLQKKRYPIADFWNSGILTNGCIAYGRDGGYLYINWNGDIMPCVFVPYKIDNIYEIYKNNGKIGDALRADMMVRGRAWQEKHQRSKDEVSNLLMPCSIRDHYANFRKNILTPDAKGENPTADEILNDAEYYRLLTEYDEKLHELTDPIWHSEYIATRKETAKPKEDKRAAQA